MSFASGYSDILGGAIKHGTVKGIRLSNAPCRDAGFHDGLEL